MSKIVIIVLVGLPAAGKTSFCDQLKVYLREKGINLFHICFDSLFKIENVNHFKTLREKFVELVRILVTGIHKKDFQTFENHLKQQHGLQLEDLARDFNSKNEISYIIVDDNNYYRSMRYKFYQIARESSCRYCQIYFEIPINVAVERDTARLATVGPEIINKMALKLEKPVFSNFWERNSIKPLELEQLVAFIAGLTPEEPLQEKLEPLPQPEMHKIDLVLRSCVHKRMQEVQKAEDKAIMAKILQEKRKSVLKDIREGVIFTNNVNFEDFLL